MPKSGTTGAVPDGVPVGTEGTVGTPVGTEGITGTEGTAGIEGIGDGTAGMLLMTGGTGGKLELVGTGATDEGLHGALANIQAEITGLEHTSRRTP